MGQDRVLRERHEDLSDTVDRIPPSGPDGALGMLVTTTTVSTYPTTAGSYFAVNPTTAGGTEAEGQAATYSPDTQRTFYAFNAGATVPPNGSHVIASAVGNRWIFRWDT